MLIANFNYFILEKLLQTLALTTLLIEIYLLLQTKKSIIFPKKK